MTESLVRTFFGVGGAIRFDVFQAPAGFVGFAFGQLLQFCWAKVIGLHTML